MSAAVGAIAFVTPPPLDLAPPAPAYEDVDPWALRDGALTDAKLLAAAADHNGPVWRALFAKWARRRGNGFALHTPSAVAPGRSLRDALFDMLAVYDVYEARTFNGAFDTTLGVPSSLPSPDDVSIMIHYDTAGARPMRMRLFNSVRLGATPVRVTVRVDTAGHTTDTVAWDVRAGQVLAAADTERPPHWLMIDWIDEQPRLRGSRELAALGVSFRVYAHYARPQRGSSLGEIERALALYAGRQYARAIPVAAGVRTGGAVSAENLVVALANCASDGADPTRVLHARVTALFDTAAGTMRFDHAACAMLGPGTAPAALYLAGNDQWARSQSPVLCSPLEGATPLGLPPNTGPAAPEPVHRMRFGHEARLVRQTPLPLTLQDRRAYVAPAPLRPLLGRRRAAWLELHLSELNPDAARLERMATAHLVVGDFDRVLWNIDTVCVELVLGWRAGTAGPYSFRTVPVRFQLAHDDSGTYAYAGLPDTTKCQRHMMPHAVHIVPTGY